MSRSTSVSSSAISSTSFWQSWRTSTPQRLCIPAKRAASSSRSLVSIGLSCEQVMVTDIVQAETALPMRKNAFCLEGRADAGRECFQ